MEYDMNEAAAAMMGLLIMVTTIAGLILKYKGLLTIGRPLERRDCAKKCLEHKELSDVIDSITKDVLLLKKQQIDIVLKT